MLKIIIKFVAALKIKNKMKQKLFENFKQGNETLWLQEAIKTAKVESIEALQTTLEEGIILKPFYTKDIENNIPAKKNNQWILLEYLSNIDENILLAQIQEAQQKGSDGVLLSQNIDNSLILKVLSKTSLKFLEVKRNIQQLDNAFLTQINNAFPWVKIIPCVENSHDFLEALNILIDFKNIHIRIQEGCFWHNQNANVIQEIAFMLSAWVEYLDKFTDKYEIENVFKRISLANNIGKNYFLEIAKIRTLLLLTSKIAATYQSKLLVNLLSITSEKTLTSQEEYNNLLRLTTESMSAVLGGTDCLCILPYNFQTEIDNFALQISRNISHLLRYESHLDKVTDVAKGSYYIEQLTQEITEKSWNLFLVLEKNGGYSKNYGQNNLLH